MVSIFFIFLYVIWKFKKRRLGIISSIAIAITISTSLPYTYNLKDTSNFIASTTKPVLHEGSTNTRLQMWKGTLYLIKENAIFGIGAGEFAFNFIPYQNKYTNLKQKENIVHSNPHNEYLRISAEYGVIFFMITMLFITYMVLKTYKKPHKDKLYIYLLLFFFIIESLFQFPLLNSFSYIYIIIIFSFLMFLNFNKVKIKSNTNTKIFHFLLILTLAFLVSSKAISSYKEVNYANYSDLETACNLFPSNWKACLSKSKIEIKNKEFFKAEETIQGVLKESPYNFPALYNAGLLYWVKGEKNKSCEYSKKYIEIFNNEKTILSGFYMKNCSPAN